jgi:6,7-dimethyl-8-ribityllumazine synthase
LLLGVFVKIAIVCAEFNEIITSKLLEGAKNALVKRGITESEILVKKVPGAFEIPLASQKVLESGYDGCIAIGAIIKGSTDHYSYVCSATANGVMSVQLKTSKPVVFCVLTCESLEQAFDRAGGKLGNKGAESAYTLLEVLS